MGADSQSILRKNRNTVSVSQTILLIAPVSTKCVGGCKQNIFRRFDEVRSFGALTALEVNQSERLIVAIATCNLSRSWQKLLFQMNY